MLPLFLFFLFSKQLISFIVLIAQPSSAPGSPDYIATYTEEWREVFIISAEVYVFGAIVYLILASGEKQWWADGVQRRRRREKHATAIKYKSINN